MSKIVQKKYVKTLEAYDQVFKSPAGQIVLLDMMKQHGILSSTFKGDINDMLIKEGERNCVLRILHILKMDVKEILERIDDEDSIMG